MISKPKDCGTGHTANDPGDINHTSVSNDAVASRPLNRAATRVGAVDQLIKNAVSGPGIISEAASYHLASGGKKFRPLFLLAIAYALRCPEKTALQTAAACELLHNASLVHDDLQDKDEKRRGRPAVWQKFGPEIAINLGDYLIASAFRLLAGLDCPHRLRVELTELFAETTRIVIDGQSEELSASRNLNLTVNDYERIARRKSGMLLALPVTSALTIAETPSYAEDASLAMQWLGIAYQIQDDLIDLFGLKDSRPAGVDLREGRVNLPVIYFRQAPKSDASLNAFSSFFKTEISASGELEYWIDRIRNSEAINQCIGHINIAVAQASQRLAYLPSELQSIIRAGQHKMLRHIDTIMQQRDSLIVSHT